MGIRDYFSFCTSLKPVELKALGNYSHPIHLEEGEVLFQAGEQSKALYFISRGIIAISPENSHIHNKETYLTRGDSLGLAEVVTRSLLTDTATACEPCSMQCVPSENLDALLAAIPAFGLFLAEQLSWRVMQNEKQNGGRSTCLDFGGNLRNFDIISIVQTINNSSKTGELVISNEEGKPVAGMYFRDGRPFCVRAHHLVGEEAFDQIFLHENMQGEFNFTPSTVPTDILEELPGNRTIDDLMINAVRQRDEFLMILSKLPPLESRLCVALPLNQWKGDAELQAAAEAIYYMASRQHIHLEELFWLNPFCEIKIYAALLDLMGQGIIEAVSSAPETQFRIVAA